MHIKETDFFGSELEISLAASNYNINIATYNHIIEKKLLMDLIILIIIITMIIMSRDIL